MFKLLLIFIVFMLGLYFSSSYTSQDVVEGFDVKQSNCPNILIQKGTELYLHNSKISSIEEIPNLSPFLPVVI